MGDEVRKVYAIVVLEWIFQSDWNVITEGFLDDSFHRVIESHPQELWLVTVKECDVKALA